jgi:hypothetical protein
MENERTQRTRTTINIGTVIEAGLFLWILLIPLSLIIHEIGHALTAEFFGVPVYSISLFMTNIASVGNSNIAFLVGLGGGFFQAIIFAAFLFCVDYLIWKQFDRKKGYKLFLLIGFELALTAHFFIGVENAFLEGFLGSTYQAAVGNLALLVGTFASAMIVACILIYEMRLAQFTSVWVFGYGSLLWFKSDVRPKDEKVGELEGWHRDWTWISNSRHGAPTCNLQPGGKVKGVFFKLNPKTQKTDLDIFRRRERESTEEMNENIKGIIGKVYFWTMGTNIEQQPEFKDLDQNHLYKALARRAVSISEKGIDGKTPVEYALLVNSFDPDDEKTRLYTNEIKNFEPNHEKVADPAQQVEVLNVRLSSLKSNRTLLTILFGIESAILTIMFGNLTKLPPQIGATIFLLASSLCLMLIAIFSLTDSIHHYSKYLEYRYMWHFQVHGLAFTLKRSDEKAVAALKDALESDDLGYQYLKYGFLTFFWFLASTVFAVPPEYLNSYQELVLFIIVSVALSLLVIFAYGETHRKSFRKAFRGFLKRKRVF